MREPAVVFAALFAACTAGALLPACKSEDPKTPASEGQSGAGGSAASGAGGSQAGASASGAGGSSSVATAGGGGSAGRAGNDDGGTGTAGSAGSVAAGAGGKGGSGGSAAGGSAAGGSAAGGSGTAGTAGSASGSGGSGGSAAPSDEHFSFFVTSLAGLLKLAKNDIGFGGNLKYGQADGLAGADKICTELAEGSMPGAGAKTWHAFLSVAKGPDGKQVNAISRVGEGPWYDRLGRPVAMTKSDLLNSRPRGADSLIVNDLPNEDGVPNHAPDPTEGPVDNHHVLTGSNEKGELYGASATCGDWTSTDKSAGRPRVGFAWPAGSRQHWISGQDEGGCGAGVSLEEMGGSNPDNPIVGSGGGYGSFYCFALTP
jgi:hypothetical protein